MRKTPYLISLVAALATLALTIVSISLPKWLHVPHPNKSLDLTYIGLYERCDLRQTAPAPPYDPKDPDPNLPLPPNTPSRPPPEPQSFPYMLFYLYTRPSGNPPVSDPTRPDNPVPPPGDKLPPKKEMLKYKCKPFPSRTACDHDGQSFCVLWTTAAYAMQLSIVFAVVVLVVLFVVSFRFSTRARRRGAWKIVGGLTGLQVALQIATMAIIVHLRKTRPSWFSDNIQYGASFILLVISWSMSFLLMVGLVGTGFAARAGHKWAAGKRGYHPIPDAH